MMSNQLRNECSNTSSKYERLSDHKFKKQCTEKVSYKALQSTNMLATKKVIAGVLGLVLVGIIIGITVYCTRSPDKISVEERTGEHKTKVEPFRVPLQRDECGLNIVETIPLNLTYHTSYAKHTDTFDCWKTLINSATQYIDIASFYWTLNVNGSGHADPTSAKGINIFNSLMEAGTKRNLSIRIVQNLPSPTFPNNDTKALQEAGAAMVQSLDMKKLLGGGIIHTKMWLVDGIHFYVGSANFDWRSLTQVKELGVMVYNCTKLATDMQKIFEVYWRMSKANATVPDKWPKSLNTSYNVENPMNINFNGTFNSSIYLSSSPPKFCPKGRTPDIDAIISTINKAEKFVHIAVMTYEPLEVYSWPKHFWPVIDDKLREVAVMRQIKVKLLISHWNHTSEISLAFLKSLAILSSTGISVEVKLFKVPCVTPHQCSIPFARVNHNKYMVTDKTAYIGTSNWSGDYFINTCGISFVLKSAQNGTDSHIRQDLADIFNRDWNSTHATNLPLNTP